MKSLAHYGKVGKLNINMILYPLGMLKQYRLTQIIMYPLLNVKPSNCRQEPFKNRHMHQQNV